MKTFFFALTFAATAFFSQAAVLSVNCVLGGQILNTGTVQFSCNNALSADAGFTLSNMQIQVLGSWSDSTTGTTNGLTFKWTSANGSTVSSSTPNNDFIGTTAPQILGNIVAIAGSTFTGGANFVTVMTTLNAGTTAFPDAQASTTINLVATQSSTATPEPTTLSLMGSALLALAGIARRRK